MSPKPEDKQVKRHKDGIIKFRSKRNFDKEKYNKDFCNAPWHVREIFDTFDEKAGFWGVLMTGIVDEHLPVKRMRANPKVFLICLVNGKLL